MSIKWWDAAAYIEAEPYSMGPMFVQAEAPEGNWDRVYT
jgi:hypothetical protein